MTPPPTTPTQTTPPQESGGVLGWAKSLFSSDKSKNTQSSAQGQAPSDGRGDVDTPEQAAAKAENQKAYTDAAYAEAKKKAEELYKYEHKVMEGGVPMGQLLDAAGSVMGSVIGPADVKFAMWGWDNRDPIARFHQSVLVGMPGENTEKMAAMLGVGRVINDMLTKGEINDKQAGMLLHEAMLGATGHVVGRESWWQRMIGAGVLSLGDPVEHAVEHQHVVASIKHHLNEVDVNALPGQVQDQMMALLKNVKEKGAAAFEPPQAPQAYASATTPPVTPKVPNPAKQEKREATHTV